MADTLAGLLGMDPAELEAALAALGPTPEMRAQANRDKWMATGLGILGAGPGNVWQGIGRGGLLGMQAGQQSLRDQLTQRGTDLQQLLALRNAAQAARMNQLGMDIANGGGQFSGAPSAGSAQPGPSLGAAPSPGQAPAPSVPAAAPPTALPGGPRWANPNAQMGFAIASGDWKKASDVAGEQMKLQIGPDGSLFRNGIPVGQKTPQGFIIYDGGDVSKPKFYANPPEADAAAARAAGAITGAQEAAKFPYQTQTYFENGQPKIGYSKNVLGAPPVEQQSGGGLIPRVNLTNVSPADLRKLADDFERNVGPAQGGGGVATGPNPAQQAQDTEIAKTFGTDYTDMIKAEKSAPATIQKYERLKNLWSQVETGKLADKVQGLKEIAAYISPDLAKGWAKDIAPQQAAQALSNAMALELRNPAGGAGMPGSLSDADRQYLQSMISSLQNDPRAIPMILDAKIALERRNQDLGAIARRYRNEHGGRVDEGLYEAFKTYSNSHPLFANSPMPATAAPAASGGWTVKQVR